ncbi:MAG TPA: HEAT repeat domain-containing protein [Gemmataceae bacterium]|nr:HEAT repeat domain-containing protein [Gemmataceae bacterium]
MSVKPRRVECMTRTSWISFPQPGAYRTTIAAVVLGIVLLGCQSQPPYEGKSPAQLQKMLRDADPTVQAQGAIGLSKLGAEARDAVPELTDLLKSPDVFARESAAMALGKVGPEAKSAVPALTAALQDPQWSVRRHAALALGQMGAEAKSSRPALEKLQSDPHDLVRQAARDTLQKVPR